MTVSPAERSALERIEREPMLRQTHLWAAINSGSANLEGLARQAELLADAFAALPGELVLREPQPVQVMDADGRLRPSEHGRNLHLTVRPEAPVQLLLTGHMDTVYAKDHTFQAVDWIEDGVLGGPGVADMKGGLTVMLAALLAVEASPTAGSVGYELVINSDEEVGSPGSAALIARAAQGKTAAFTYEPAIAPDGTLAAARPGSGNFSIMVRGRSAHAGRNPEDGRNAVLAAAELALRLAEGGGPDLSVNPARIDGGGPNNVVPDHAIVRVNLRPRTAEAQRRAEALLDDVMKQVARTREVELSLHGGFGRPPKPFEPAAGLFGFVARCGADLGQSIAWRDTGGVCDGNIVAAQGVPVIDTMGVRGGAIHSAEEYLIVDSLVERAQLSALAIMRLAAGEPL